MRLPGLLAGVAIGALLAGLANGSMYVAVVLVVVGALFTTGGYYIGRLDGRGMLDGERRP